MPRIARMVALDYPHHVIHRGNNKQDIFFDDRDKELYLYLLRKYSTECGCKVHAYCLMANHVHILIVPLHEYSLARAMQKLALTYTQHINKKYRRTGRLWECRFHSAIVDTGAYMLTVCRYIERNPVRAGLVTEPTLYKWSSAQINVADLRSNLVEPIWHNYVKKEEYAEFLNIHDDKDDMRKIRKSTHNGKPIAREDFSKYITDKLGVTLNTKPIGRPRRK